MNRRWITIGVGVIIVVFVALLIHRWNNSTDIVDDGIGTDFGVAQEDPTTSAQELYTQANQLREQHEIPQAIDTLQEILVQHPDYENVEKVQSELEAMTLQIIFSDIDVPGP